MKETQTSFWKALGAVCGLAAVLALNIAPFQALGLDRQNLPMDTRAASGFTHVMRILYTDVTNGVTHNLWRLYPGSGNGAIGDAIDAVGVYIETPFWVTNANAGSNSVFLNVGFALGTNNLISQFGVGSNSTQRVLITNAPPVSVLSAATNFWVTSLTVSNTEMAAQLISGEAHIFFRVRQFDRLKNY